jgi:hypothetical protein
MTWHLDNGTHFSDEEVKGLLVTKTVDEQLFFKVCPRCPWLIKAIGECDAVQHLAYTTKKGVVEEFLLEIVGARRDQGTAQRWDGCR